MWNLKKTELMETESRLVVTKGRSGGCVKEGANFQLEANSRDIMSSTVTIVNSIVSYI